MIFRSVFISMGAYLSVPVTEKVSNDEEGKYLDYGASSMQGWRVSQEDAHNSIINFDDQTHLFAVYDGHGGHEVAAYAALKLPEFIKAAEDYKKEHIPECLKKAFLSFDSTLVKLEVVNTLKQIAGTKDDDTDSEEEEEEVDNLYKEATMPLDEVMAKYAENPHLVRCKKEIKGVSPFLRAKGGCSESHTEEPPIKFDLEVGESSEMDCPTSSTSKHDVNEGDKSVKASISDVFVKDDDIEEEIEEEEEESEGHQNGVEPQTSSHINGGENKHVNGEVDEEMKAEEEIKETEDCDKVLNGGEEVKLGKGKSVKGGKGKTLLKNSEVQALKEAKTKEKRRLAAVKAAEIYRKLQEGTSEDELSDEEEEDEDDDNFEDEVEDEEDEGEESDDDDEEEELGQEDDPNAEFAMNMKEEPGFDSGCTACLALMRGTELYVANVGDSRIVVCRDGKAIDMSVDHKPEDDPEAARIIKAGGRVTEDGRVNGGLNLSRAFGDHGYKQNKNLEREEQMISPLPDVRSMTLIPEDAFMIVACDGIWNSLSSQEACDFVSERLGEDKKLSTICEELFDHCLAPNTMGDGTGCDNMTCIIVKFKDLAILSSASGKRTSDQAENEEVRPEEKKLKCDEK